MVATIIQAIRNKGMDLIARQNASGRTRREQELAPPATGIITTIWDKGFGFIGRDKRSDRSDLYFHRTAVDGDGFDGLRQGQHVSFDEEADPRDRNHRRAVNVRPAAGTDDG